MGMGRRTLLLATTCLLGVPAARAAADAALLQATRAAPPPPPPVTPKRPVRLERWGHVRVDEYGWLRDPDWFARLQHPETLQPGIRAHLDAENAYADAVLQPTLALQAELLREMQARTATGDSEPPEPDGDWLYWSQTRPGAQQPVYLRRRRGGTGPGQVLLDADADAHGRAYYRLSSLKRPAHSPDGRYFAWAVDVRGDEHFELHVIETATGRAACVPIADCYGDFVFSTDSRSIFWLLRDAHSRPTRVFRRPLSGGPDRLVYEEHDPAFFVTLSRTASNGYVLITALNATASEIRVIAAADQAALPRLIEPRSPGLVYALDHWGDRFVIRTNADGAVDNKLMLAGIDRPGRAYWRELVPYRPGRAITDMRAFGGHLAWIEWIDANPVLLTMDRTGGARRQAGCDDAAYALGLDPDAAYDSTLVRFSCQSPRRPVQWETLDMASGARRVVWRQAVAGVDPRNYVVERIDVAAADGVRVPVSLLRHRDTARDGQAPLMLYGYGAYGFNLPADFSVPDLSLADRGWMVAIAHVRGGAERGMAWNTQTLTTGKHRTISDFVDCAAHLAKADYTAAGRIVGHSFSAGGIMIGGAINLRPELFAGAIGQVPFVDVLNTMQDSSNPLVASARPIWGDPDDRTMFESMAAFSPYETVRRAAYPAVLATAGLLDDRVGYWEAAKWVARLRDRSTGHRPVMLLTNMHAGHQGDAGADDLLRQRALFAAFAIRAASDAWR